MGQVTEGMTSTDGSIVKPSLAEQLAQAEQDLVLKTFEELKRRGDGEMRVAVRREKGRAIPEITYCGIAERADLEGLRKMYRELANKGARF